MFKPQFASLVISGEKCQTVRPVPKRMPKPGDKMSCRVWDDKPYWSKQRVLREVTLTRVAPVRITPDQIIVDGMALDTLEAEFAFARADGFNTTQDLLDWFNFTHGLPFDGVLLQW